MDRRRLSRPEGLPLNLGGCGLVPSAIGRCLIDDDGGPLIYGVASEQQRTRCSSNRFPAARKCRFRANCGPFEMAGFFLLQKPLAGETGTVTAEPASPLSTVRRAAFDTPNLYDRFSTLESSSRIT